VSWAPTSTTPEPNCPITEADQLTFAKAGGRKRARQRDLRKVEVAAQVMPVRSRGLGEAMNELNNDVPKFVTQARAAYLLGIPESELRRISAETGIGHLERAGREEKMYFTYDELQQICRMATDQLEAGH
jgi:hypothetical protein